MASLWSRTNRWLAWFHRWAGVAFCLLFAIWFASGAVLHFIGFPSLPAAEQRAAAESVDLSRISVDPAAAFARMPESIDLRLVSVAGRPVYLGTTAAGVVTRVAGDSGDVLPIFGPETARAVAEHFAREAALEVSDPLDYDQWIVHQRYDALRPLYRVRLHDGARTDLYISARTGEVVQRTRFSERAWNWSGAVVHWIYFTPLRKSWPAWNQVVWWLALAALLSAAVGTWLGLVRFAAVRARGLPGLSPFRGWMRWHHIAGLIVCVDVVSWILSGWLSMDHGRLFSHGDASREQMQQMRGMTLASTARTATLESMAALAPVSSIEFNAVAGRPLLTAYGAADAIPRVSFLDQPGSTTTKLSDALLLSGVERVWRNARPPFTTASVEYDELYRRAESAGKSAAVFVGGPDGGLRVYVDRYTGRLVAVMDSSRRVYAWLYYALHTLQFPVLIAHPDLRTAAVLLLLAAGFAFSLTGVVLGVSRLRRELT